MNICKYQQQRKSNDFDWIIEPGDGCGLALGNIRIASDNQRLKQQKIGAVISIFGDEDLTINSSIKHLRILISDNPKQNIKCFFQCSFSFIEQNIKKVLVHCQAGVSRSTTIVAAYLMKAKNLSHNQALQHVRSRRPKVAPNKGFLKQLEQYRKELQQSNQENYKTCENM